MWEKIKNGLGDFTVDFLLAVFFLLATVFLGLRWLIDKIFQLHLDEREEENKRKRWEKESMEAKWKSKEWFTENNLPVIRFYKETKQWGLIYQAGADFLRYRRPELHIRVTQDKDLDPDKAYEEGLDEITIQSLEWRIKKCIRIDLDVPVADIKVEGAADIKAYTERLIRRLGFDEKTVHIC